MGQEDDSPRRPRRHGGVGLIRRSAGQRYGPQARIAQRSPPRVLRDRIVHRGPNRPSGREPRPTPVEPPCQTRASSAPGRNASSRRDHTGMSRAPEANSSPRVTGSFVSARTTRVSAVRHPGSRRSNTSAAVRTVAPGRVQRIARSPGPPAPSPAASGPGRTHSPPAGGSPPCPTSSAAGSRS